MKIKNYLILSFSLLVMASAHAQEKVKKQIPSVSLGMGVLTFNGDVGNGLKLSSYSKLNYGYQISVQDRFNRFFGVSLSALMGKLSSNDNTPVSHLNFQSKIVQADLNLVFHFDNDAILKSGSTIAPYIFAGVGFLKFDTYGDLKDKDNNTYNYWSDGSIRTLPQTDPNAQTAKFTKRDYSYETQLKDSTKNYARNSISLPLGAGFKMKLSDNIQVNLGATYYFALTDYIDNVKLGANDKYLYTNFSLQYNFGSPFDDSDKRYKTVDFSALNKLDSDGDGVYDDDDRCPGTPKNVKTDSRGCPMDKDGDAIPDYRDQEPNSKKGAIVDENGITQTDLVIAQKQAQRDSLATERAQLFSENPSLSYLRTVEAKSIEQRNAEDEMTAKIPFALRIADKDKDGFISIDEIFEAIDAFFDGDSDYTVEKLNNLLDYFFAQ
jgi:opacity protein-like surface antigen